MSKSNPAGKLRIPLELLNATQKRALEIKKRRREEREKHYSKSLRGQERAFVDMFDHPIDKSKGWINRLRETARTGGSWATYSSYKYRSIYFLEWLKIYKKHPFSLDTNDALTFQQWLQSLDTTFRGMPMLNRYRNMIFDSVRNMYDYFLLKSVGYMEEDTLIRLPINPFKKIPNLREDIRIRERFLTDEQLDELSDFVSEHEIPTYYKIAIWLGLYAGLRISEANTIRFNDVSIVKQDDKEIVVIKVFGKGRKERQTIYIDEETKQAFLDYVNHVKETYEAVKSGKSGEELEILNRLVPVDLKSMARFMFVLGKELSFEFTFHKLRHTYGYTLTQQGVPLETTAHLLGHSSLETTRIYDEVNTSRAIRDIYK